MNTPSKKFFESFQLVSKFFSGVDFEKIHEYTFEKILLKLFDYFEWGVYYKDNLEYSFEKKFFEAV